MNLPNLPTDNLYKFLALSGIFLCITCLVIKSVEFQSFSAKRANALNQLVDIQRDLDNIVITKDTLDEAKKQTQLINTEVEKERNDIKALREPYDQNKSLYNLGIGVGFFVSIVGFLLWYLKVQRYEDKLLKSNTLK